jgi:nitrous oxide reductase accessory protein NosL
MKNALAVLIVAASLLGFACAPSISAPKPTAHAAAKTMKCPYCGMMMSTKKSAMAPAAVKIKGVTYYCCKGCAMGQKALKSAHKSSMKKTM